MVFYLVEIFFFSFVVWFFDLGVMLYSKDFFILFVCIKSDGLNLFIGGINDGVFWIDFFEDGSRDLVKMGNLEFVEVYIYFKLVYGVIYIDF